MAKWFYAVGEDQLGPVDPSEMARLIDADAIGPDTLIWKTGMNDWELAAWHFEFDADGTPPPLRPAQRAADPDIGADGLYVGAPSREFVEAARVCLSKYATFSGRASRSEFWFFYLFWNIVVVVAQIVDFGIIMGFMMSGSRFMFPFVSLIAIFGMMIPQLAVSWRRLHDIDRTGWWLGGGMIAIALIYTILFVTVSSSMATRTPGDEPPQAILAMIGLLVIVLIPYSITIFIFYVTKGTLGRNRFG